MKGFLQKKSKNKKKVESLGTAFFIEDYLVIAELALVVLTGLVLYPVGNGSKKGCFFKNILTPPKIGPTCPGFGRIYLHILWGSTRLLSYVFLYLIKIVRSRLTCLCVTYGCGLMGIFKKVTKNGQNTTQNTSRRTKFCIK